MTNGPAHQREPACPTPLPYLLHRITSLCATIRRASSSHCFSHRHHRSTQKTWTADCCSSTAEPSVIAAVNRVTAAAQTDGSADRDPLTAAIRAAPTDVPAFPSVPAGQRAVAQNCGSADGRPAPEAYRRHAVCPDERGSLDTAHAYRCGCPCWNRGRRYPDRYCHCRDLHYPGRCCDRHYPGHCQHHHCSGRRYRDHRCGRCSRRRSRGSPTSC